MMTENMDTINSSGYVFKVLSGSMNGIEFSLSSHAYFMCVNNLDEGQADFAHNLDYAERTLYLPSSTPGHNFIVHLEKDATDNEFTVTISHPDRQEKITFAFNTVCHVDGTYFAVKQEGTAWSPDVVNVVKHKAVLPVAANTEANSDLIHISKMKKGASGWKYSLGVATSLLLLLGVISGGTLAWQKYETSSSSERTADLMQQLVGNNVGYSVQQGRDNVYYLFAQNSQQAEWARRSEARAQSGVSWKIQTPEEEEIRLARELERDKVAFFTVRFNDLNAPILIMSSTRNATDPVTLEQVKSKLLEAMPYAKKISVELKSDEEILRTAEEGLVALGFDYQLTQSDSGVTLSTSISSSDDRMAEFNRFVSQFYRLWGRHYIHFSAVLHEDTLKEKSFKYGDDGYIKMGKSHWVFNT